MSEADPQGVQRLASLMAEAGERPYRELVQHHVRKQTEIQLRDAAVWEVSQLPEGMRALGIMFIDVVNERLAYDARFWRRPHVETPTTASSKLLSRYSVVGR